MSGGIPRRRRPPLTVGELTAWQAGTAWRRAGRPATEAVRLSNRGLAAAVGGDAAEALWAMGRDVFAYWFFKGFDDQGAGAVR